jgi:hypothetical protein
MIKKFLLVVMATISVMLPVSAGTAHAAGEAYNHKYEYITANPNSGMPISVVSRRIYLASGNYQWRSIRQSRECNRNIYLGAGWYLWIDQLWPKDGYYDHYSYLDPDNPGGTALLRCKWTKTVSQNETWGSYLVPF